MARSVVWDWKSVCYWQLRSVYRKGQVYEWALLYNPFHAVLAGVRLARILRPYQGFVSIHDML